MLEKRVDSTARNEEMPGIAESETALDKFSHQSLYRAKDSVLSLIIAEMQHI